MLLKLNQFLLALSAVIALQSCKPSSKPASPAVQENTADKVQEAKPVVAETISEGKLYEFFMTVDPQYCDMDSLVEGDCNSGFLYFTPRGNVIYTYSCMGATSLCYEVGHVTYENDKFTCSFDQIYNVPFPDDNPDGLDSLSLQQLNSGQLKKMKRHVFDLQILECKESAYAFKYMDMTERYVLLPEDETGSSFMEDFARIKILQQF